MLRELLNPNSDVSSSRFINLGGWVTGTLLLAYEAYLHGLDVGVFGVYLAYCGGVYGVGVATSAVKSKVKKDV
jgi:hypothetical protein